jgi:GLPGLI family protein
VKCHITYISLFGLFFYSYAQTEEPIKYSIQYSFIHVSDTMQRDNPVTYNMMLEVANSISRYSLFTNKVKTNPKQVPNNQPKGAMKVAVGRPIAVIPSDQMANEFLFQKIYDKKFLLLGTIGTQDYLMEQPLIVHNWKMHNEQKKIADIICQKATCRYAGRNYTAWFAPSIPLPYGPWKLWGLPGLILEAIDEKKEVQFLFKEISASEGTINTKDIGYRPVKISESAYKKALQQFDTDPGGVVKSTLPPNDPSRVEVFYKDPTGQITSVADTDKAIFNHQKRIINNPLELKNK